MRAAATAQNNSAEIGLGLRPPLYPIARDGKIPIDWLELITENFMVPGGQPLAVLEDVRQHARFIGSPGTAAREHEACARSAQRSSPGRERVCRAKTADWRR